MLARLANGYPTVSPTVPPSVRWTREGMSRDSPRPFDWYPSRDCSESEQSNNASPIPLTPRYKSVNPLIKPSAPPQRASRFSVEFSLSLGSNCSARPMIFPKVSLQIVPAAGITQHNQSLGLAAPCFSHDLGFYCAAVVSLDFAIRSPIRPRRATAIARRSVCTGKYQPAGDGPSSSRQRCGTASKAAR